MKNVLALLVSCSLVAAVCGDTPQIDEAVPDAAMIAEATVTIPQPTAGSDVVGSSVTVRLTVTGIPIVSAVT